MSTDEEIREVYLEDMKFPFDVVNGGKPKKRVVLQLSRKVGKRTIIRAWFNESKLIRETSPDWKWNHFRDAFVKAGFGTKNYDPFRAYRQLERMLPGVNL